MPKPPKFQVGQAVVCVRSAVLSDYPGFSPQPQVGQLLEVTALKQYTGPLTRFHGVWVYRVGTAYPWLAEWILAPVQLLPDEALAALLEETLAPVPA